MTDNSQSAPAGWRDDPDDATMVRYWDGQAWTEHRSVKVVAPTASGDGQQPAAAQAWATQPVATPGGPAGPKSGAPWWLAAVIGVVALLAGVGIGVVVAGLGSDDEQATVTVTANPTDPTEEATEGPTEEPTEEPTSEATSDRGTATDPLDMTAPWTYDASYFGEDGTQWEGAFEGIVPVPLDAYDEDTTARCYAIYGTMTPTQIADDAFVADGFDAPYIEFVVGGKVVNEYGYCDTSALKAAGYDELYNAQVSIGTDYKFYQVIYLPSTVTGDIELAVLGYASEPDSWYFKPTFKDSVG